MAEGHESACRQRADGIAMGWQWAQVKLHVLLRCRPAPHTHTTGSEHHGGKPATGKGALWPAPPALLIQLRLPVGTAVVNHCASHVIAKAAALANASATQPAQSRLRSFGSAAAAFTWLCSWLTVRQTCTG